MADEEDEKDDYFLEMSHCGLKVTGQGFKCQRKIFEHMLLVPFLESILTDDFRGGERFMK